MKPRKHFEQCQLYCAMEFMAFCDLGELASRLANPFGHLSQVRTQVLVLQTCVDFHQLASPFGQGLKLISNCEHISCTLHSP